MRASSAREDSCWARSAESVALRKITPRLSWCSSRPLFPPSPSACLSALLWGSSSARETRMEGREGRCEGSHCEQLQQPEDIQ